MPDDFDQAPFAEFAQPNDVEDLIMNRLRANPSGAERPQRIMPQTSGGGPSGDSPDELIRFLLGQMENARAPR
jgi:hypothetical protein